MGFMCDCAGSMREIDVIDVARQQDGKMLMRDWTEYYNSQHRRKIYNVISLEFTNTKWAARFLLIVLILVNNSSNQS